MGGRFDSDPSCLGIDIQILETDDPQTGGEVFIIGDQAMIVDALDQLRQHQFLLRGHQLQDTPKGLFQSDRGRVAVDAKAPLFRDEFRYLVRGAGIEHVLQHAIRL